MKNVLIGQLYGKVGLIVSLSQMIEYNLAIIISLNEILSAFEKQESMYTFEYNEIVQSSNKWYSKLIKSTLGFTLSEVKKVKYFNKKSEEILEEILQERNHVIHHFFKDDIGKDELYHDPKSSFDRLENLIERMNNANTDLCDIIIKQKNEYSLIR